MTTREIKRRIPRKAAVGGAIAAVLLAVGATLAINGSVFQLDGNAVDDGTGDDWGTLFPTNTSATVIARSFVDDHPAVDDTYFTGGSSKDDIDIDTAGTTGGWLRDRTSSAQPKADIIDAFAASYSDPAAGPTFGHQLIYFGADRFSNDGNTFMGFWFLKNGITYGPAASNGVGEIIGNHTVGDVLVLTDFASGEPVQNFKIYQWVASGGDAAEHLQLVDPGTDCQVTNTGDACSTVNDAIETSPWPFIPKSNVGDPDEFAPGLFIEGGIDLTALIPSSDGCFSAFVAETRASSSVSASLSDFAYGEFDTCGGITIRKTTNPTPDATDFGFTTTGQAPLGGVFTLDTDATSAGTPDNVVFTAVKPGQYKITETVASGWDLASVTCTLSSGTTSSVSGSELTINLATSGTADCTFHNVKRGDIKIVKNTVGGDGTFSFTTGGIAGLDTSYTTVAGTDNDTSDKIVPGNAYAISETVPTGWDLTSLACTLQGGGATGTVASPGITAITVEAGKTTTCTFQNTKRGDIKLIKNTVGGDGTFAFTHSIAGLLSSLTTVSGTANDTSDKLVPGAAYAVAEGTVPTGWSFTSATCTLEGGGATGTVNGQAITAITVEAGKTTTCTFTNTALYRVLVLVCNETNLDLYGSDVTFGLETKGTRTSATLPALANFSGTTDQLMAYLCGLGGAQFNGLASNSLPAALHNFGVRIPTPS